MKTITLKRGVKCLVDDEYYLELSRYNWNLVGGYPARRVGGVSGYYIFLHHVVSGNPPYNLDLDHIDGDCLNNQRINHRFIPHAANCLNNGKSCVYPSARKFVVNVQGTNLGSFTNYEKAKLVAREFKETQFKLLLEPWREFNLHLSEDQYYFLR